MLEVLCCFDSFQHSVQDEQLVEFLRFQSQDFVAINASDQNQLKPIQYVESRLRIPFLLCMVTSNLTDRNQSVLFHSPFPTHSLSWFIINSYERIFYSRTGLVFNECS
jgi:hypothetical protein